MKFRLLAMAAALAMTTGAMAQDAAMTPTPAAMTTKSGPLAAPVPGKGQVVFFRPGSMIGMAMGCTVRENDAGGAAQELARLGSGKFYVVDAEPGRHEYFTTGEATDKLALEIEPDETYFVRCNIGMGIMAGRANLSPSDRDAFAKKAKGLKMWAGPKEKDGDKSGDLRRGVILEPFLKAGGGCPAF